MESCGYQLHVPGESTPVSPAKSSPSMSPEQASLPPFVDPCTPGALSLRFVADSGEAPDPEPPQDGGDFEEPGPDDALWTSSHEEAHDFSSNVRETSVLSEAGPAPPELLDEPRGDDGC